jgi:hypothetical protein
MFRGIFVVLILISTLTSVYSQKLSIVEVHDAQTGEPLPFVKVSENKQTPLLTDVDGRVKLVINPTSSYHFSFYDYKDTILTGEQIISAKRLVNLIPESKLFDEVIILPGENPAHRIIQNAMDRRKDNDPMRNNSFQYEGFSRFYLNGETTHEINRDTITDTSLIKTFKLFDEQYLFLTETASERIFSPPNYDKETVTSYKVSGLKNPLFASLVNQFQSFSFYANIFSIGDIDYINPIAPGGIRRYLFILEDTLVKGSDTTFTMSFRPRKGKIFEGLKGHISINSKGWAIERIIAEPYEAQESFKVKIIQEYKFTGEKKWFPYQLSTEFQFPGLKINNYHQLIGRSNLYVKNVQFDVDIKKGFNAVKLEVLPDAVDDTLGLRNARGTQSTTKDLNTYHVVDSISKEMNFEQLVDFAAILSTGKIPIKKISIPIWRLSDFNQHEGYRLGLGLETNSRLSKHFSLGGYFAYGFRDEAWKWGGNLDVVLAQKRQIKLELAYNDDVFERGGIDYSTYNFDLTSGDVYRNFFINQMERQRKATVALGGYLTQNFHFKLESNYRRINFLDDYSFSPLVHEDGTLSSTFDAAETGIVVNWTIREKVMLLGEQRVSLGSKFPKIQLKAMKGWNTIFDGQLDYYRFNLAVNQNFTIRGVGKLQLNSTSGLTIGEVPLAFMQMPFGTNRNWNLTVPNTFETMLPSEFFTDKHTAFFLRFAFLPLKNKTSFTEPQFIIHSAAGVGEMRNQQLHNHTFNVHEKGFYEAGLIVDNLIILGSSGFGIGVFHRFGAYAFPEMKDNFVYKLSLKFNF